MPDFILVLDVHSNIPTSGYIICNSSNRLYSLSICFYSTGHNGSTIAVAYTITHSHLQIYSEFGRNSNNVWFGWWRCRKGYGGKALHPKIIIKAIFYVIKWISCWMNLTSPPKKKSSRWSRQKICESTLYMYAIFVMVKYFTNRNVLNCSTYSACALGECHVG